VFLLLLFFSPKQNGFVGQEIPSFPHSFLHGIKPNLKAAAERKAKWRTTMSAVILLHSSVTMQHFTVKCFLTDETHHGSIHVFWVITKKHNHV